MAAEDSKAQIPDVSDFFPEVSEDLSKVIWAHAVNSKAELEKHVADGSIMMLEADVSPGHLEDDISGPVIPIMAHPPIDVSDLSFEMFIDGVIKANEEGKKKGAKLDFKYISAVEDCLKILQDRSDQITFPLWLNADILKSTDKDAHGAVDADKFLTLCAEYFPMATLSVGWTTVFTGDGSYTKEMVDEMSTLLEAKGVSQPITFPIRAAFVPRSLENLEWLVDNIPESTISVWSSAADEIDIQALISLRDSIGHDMVYFDLPEEQMKEFNDAKDAEEGAAAPTFQILPNNASAWATVGMALASALAALYLYE